MAFVMTTERKKVEKESFCCSLWMIAPTQCPNNAARKEDTTVLRDSKRQYLLFDPLLAFFFWPDNTGRK